MEYTKWAILTIFLFVAVALAYTAVVFKLFPNTATVNLLDYIIIGTALSFGMIAFLAFPPDIAESGSLQNGSTNASKSPLVGLWKFLFFGWLIFNWVVIFFYKQILKSGHWNFWARLGHGILRTLVLYLVIGVPAVIIVIVLIATRRFTAKFLYSLLLSVINTIGTFQIVLFLAYGIVDVPRRLVIAAFPSLRLYQVYYEAFKISRNIRKIYKGVVLHRSRQSIGLAVIPRTNYMYIYSHRLNELQLVPNEQLEAFASAAGKQPTNVVMPCDDSQNKPTVDSRSKSRGSSARPNSIHESRYSSTYKPKDSQYDSRYRNATEGSLPPKSHYSEKSSRPPRSNYEIEMVSARSSSSARNTSGRQDSTASANDETEPSSSKYLRGSTEMEPHTSMVDMHPVEIVGTKPPSIYTTQEIQLAGRRIRFPKSPSIDDMPYCSCNCHGGNRRSITSSVLQGLKLVEKSNFKLKFLYWNAMREHAAMEHLIVQRNYYEMLVQAKEKGCTLEDLKGRQNLNPHWVKMFGKRRLGPMTFTYLRHFRSVLLMFAAIIFTFFSVVVVLSEFMSPFSALAKHSPLLKLYDAIVTSPATQSNGIIILYFIFALIVAYLQCALLNLKFFNVFKLVKKASDIPSLLFIVARVPTYIFPLGWNLMLLLNIQINTAYGGVMSQMSAIPIMGIEFSNYFPIVMIILTIFFASNLSRIVFMAMGQDITPNLICSLRQNYKVEEGKAILSQWVDGTFQYIKTEEDPGQRPPNCCTKCMRSIFAPANDGE